MRMCALPLLNAVRVLRSAFMSDCVTPECRQMA